MPRKSPKPDSGGRPRNAEPKTWISTSLPSSDHDKLIDLANKLETSVSALVRSLLKLKMKKQR